MIDMPNGRDNVKTNNNYSYSKLYNSLFYSPPSIDHLRCLYVKVSSYLGICIGNTNNALIFNLYNIRNCIHGI